MELALLIARLVLAAVFIVAGLAKLADQEGSREAMVGFGVPQPLARPFALLLPPVEIIVAILLIPLGSAWYGAIGAAALLLLFVVGIAVSMARGVAPDCHCFGSIHSEPAGWRTLVRNGILAAVAGFVIYQGQNDAGASASGWFTALSGGVQAALLLGAAAVLLVFAQGSVLLNLMRQNGRLLTRLESLEGILSPSDEEDVPALAPVGSGLPLGSPAPAFRLAGLHGETLTLDALRAAGKSVMLLFSDPNCGPCNALLPEIGRWQRDHSAQLTIAMLTRGDADANKKKTSQHGVTTTLLQENREIAELYKAPATPSAVIVRADGTIGSWVAAGSVAITNLLEQTVSGQAPQAATLPVSGRVPARPVAPGAATRNGVPAATANGRAQAPAAPAQAQAPLQPAPVGTRPAPTVSLPDLNGGTRSLEDFRGSNTMVLFWNPGCGFCQRMVDDLKTLEANPPSGGPKLLVVSTGTPEVNRAQGLRAPLLIDQGFATGRQFGAGGTPSAVLIDANGNIASGVAVGAPAVLDMAYNRGIPPVEAAAPARGNGAAAAVRPAQAQPLAPLAPRLGQKAPELKLPDLDGKQVDLADFRGATTMLVFWNPGCGFCRRMVDDLKALEANPPANAPKLLVVSTGAADANRATGLESTILLDQNFTVGRQFGANGTPSAVLIDAKGNIASQVAVGAPAVLALAGVTQDAPA